MPAGEVGDGALTKPACRGVCQQVRAGMARLQSTPAVFGSMERAYKARLQFLGVWSALTKHACSGGMPAGEVGDGALTSTPAVFGSMERAYKARLQLGCALTKHACSFWGYGARFQSTPAVGVCQQLRSGMARFQSTPAVGVCQQLRSGMARFQSTPAVGVCQQLRSGMARLQSTPAVFGSMERAYKARLPWGMPAGDGGDGALPKHACSFWEYGARFQSTPAVFGSMERASKARLQFLGVWSALPKHACSFWEYGARLQSTKSRNQRYECLLAFPGYECQKAFPAYRWRYIYYPINKLI